MPRRFVKKKDGSMYLAEPERGLLDVKIPTNNVCSDPGWREEYELCARTETNTGCSVLLDSIVTKHAPALAGAPTWGSTTREEAAKRLTSPSRYHSLTPQQARQLAKQLVLASEIAEENAKPPFETIIFETEK